MIFWLILVIANLAVGACVGLTGVAGFLLPLVYTGLLGLSVTEGLALSFGAFILSGVIGSINYRKAGNLDLAFGVRLGVGSFLGSVLGVFLNQLIPEEHVKILLYVVVLLSGISILLRKEPNDTEAEQKGPGFLQRHVSATVALGFVTGAICAMSGAGGPVLVMPLLMLFGCSARMAVGVALFDSIFIGIPACAGYLSQCRITDLLLSLVIALVFHGIGVAVGSKNATKINQVVLKRIIAIGSIFIAVWRLLFP